MATAIYVKTESGDEYVWCLIDTLDEDQVDSYLEEELGDEYDYIANMITTTDIVGRVYG